MLMRADGRLTQRGRLLRTSLGVAALAAALVFAPRAFAVGPEEPVRSDTYTVAPGDTLWSIARSIAPGEPTDRTVAVIQELNGRSTASLRAGEQILVPVAP